MAVVLVVNNTPFDFPEPGEQAPWAEGVTDWSTEVTKVLNSLSGPSDILETSAIIDNNVLTPTDIGNFFFNPATVRSFSAVCSIYRQANTSEISEQINIVGLYTGTGGWLLQQDGIGNAGITLTITSGGQIRYVTTNFSGLPYSGIIKFRATGILST